MRPLIALLLSDGRPGHYHLSDGIVAAIGRKRPVELVRVDVRRGPWPGRLLAAVTNQDWPPQHILRLVYGIKADGLPRADVIVSAGAETLAANVAAARLLGAPNIFYGSLRAFRETDFALNLTSYAPAESATRQVMALKPSPLDPDTLPPRPERAKPGPNAPPAVVGLLIGGNSGSFRYEQPDWESLFRLVRAMHARHGTRWIISNSRRTGDGVSDLFAAAARGPGGPVLEFIDVRRHGAGTLRSVFERAEIIVCTEDSSSMLSEAIATRLPVLGVTPQRFGFSDEERGYRIFLMERGWCRTLPLAELEPERFLAEAALVTPMAHNPLDRLAGLLEERLPGLFAPSA
jgi:hypothetical protein